MFNGYNETPLTSYNEFDEKKSENVSKWTYGHEADVQASQTHPTTRQSDLWSGKSHFVGAPNIPTSKCNCSGCYSSTESQSYHGESTRHRPWLPRSFPVPLTGSNEICRLPGYHQQWENMKVENKGCIYPDGNHSSQPQVQEASGKHLYYRPYPNSRLEPNQPGVITSAKKDNMLKKDEIQTEMGFHEQNGTRHPVFGGNLNYNLTKNLEKNRNYCDLNEKYSNLEPHRHNVNVNSYPVDQHMIRLPVTESHLRTASSNVSLNRVPSTGHQNILQSAVYNPRKMMCSESVSAEKNGRVNYLPSVVKNGSCSENFHQIPSGDLKNSIMFPTNRAFNMSMPCGNVYDSEAQKLFYENTRHPDFCNFSDVIKRNTFAPILENRKECDISEQVQKSAHYSKNIDLGNAKNSCGVFYSKEYNAENFTDNSSPFQMGENLSKTDGIDRFHSTTLNFNDSHRTQNSFPYRNNSPGYRQYLRSECPYVGYNGQSRHEYSPVGLQRNDLNQLPQRNIQQQLPNCGADQYLSQGSPAVHYNSHASHYQSLSDKITQEPFHYSKNQLPTNLINSQDCRLSDTKNMNHLETIRSEEINKSGSSKISPLRLLRKKKFVNPSISETPPITAVSESAPALDVRKFWSTWAEEEDESVTTSQMVVLDCQNIDPEQAKLLHLYESDPVGAVHLESGNIVTFKEPGCVENNLQDKIINENLMLLNDQKTEEEISKQIQREESSSEKITETCQELTKSEYEINEETTRPKTMTVESVFQEMSNENEIKHKPCKKVRSSLSQESKGVIDSEKNSLDKKTDKGRLDKWTEKKFDFLKRAEESKAAEILRHEEEKKKIFERRLSFQSEVDGKKLSPKAEEPSSRTQNIIEKKNQEDIFTKFSHLNDNSQSSLENKKIDSPDLPTSEYRRNKFLDYSEKKCEANSYYKESNREKDKVQENVNRFLKETQVADIEETKKQIIKLESLAKGENKSDFQVSTNASSINGIKPKEETGLDDVMKKMSEINFQSKDVKFEDEGKSQTKLDSGRKIKVLSNKKGKKYKKLEYGRTMDESSDEVTVENISMSKPTIKFSIQKSHDLKISFKVLNGNNKKYGNSEEETEKETCEDEESATEISKNSAELITLKLKSVQRDGSTFERSQKKKDRIEDLKENKIRYRKKVRGNRKSKKHKYEIQNEEKDPLGEDNGLNLSRKPQDDFQVQETVDSAKIKLTFKRHKAIYKNNVEREEGIGTWKREAHGEELDKKDRLGRKSRREKVPAEESNGLCDIKPKKLKNKIFSSGSIKVEPEFPNEDLYQNVDFYSEEKEQTFDEKSVTDLPEVTSDPEFRVSTPETKFKDEETLHAVPVDEKSIKDKGNGDTDWVSTYDVEEVIVPDVRFDVERDKTGSCVNEIGDSETSNNNKCQKSSPVVKTRKKETDVTENNKESQIGSFFGKDDAKGSTTAGTIDDIVDNDSVVSLEKEDVEEIIKGVTSGDLICKNSNNKNENNSMEKDDDTDKCKSLIFYPNENMEKCNATDKKVTDGTNDKCFNQEIIECDKDSPYETFEDFEKVYDEDETNDGIESPTGAFMGKADAEESATDEVTSTSLNTFLDEKEETNGSTKSIVPDRQYLIATKKENSNDEAKKEVINFAENLETNEWQSLEFCSNENTEENSKTEDHLRKETSGTIPLQSPTVDSINIKTGSNCPNEETEGQFFATSETENVEAEDTVKQNPVSTVDNQESYETMDVKDDEYNLLNSIEKERTEANVEIDEANGSDSEVYVSVADEKKNLENSVTTEKTGDSVQNKGLSCFKNKDVEERVTVNEENGFGEYKKRISFKKFETENSTETGSEFNEAEDNNKTSSEREIENNSVSQVAVERSKCQSLFSFDNEEGVENSLQLNVNENKASEISEIEVTEESTTLNGTDEEYKTSTYIDEVEKEKSTMVKESGNEYKKLSLSLCEKISLDFNKNVNKKDKENFNVCEISKTEEISRQVVASDNSKVFQTEEREINRNQINAFGDENISTKNFEKIKSSYNSKSDVDEETEKLYDIQSVTVTEEAEKLKSPENFKYTSPKNESESNKFKYITSHSTLISDEEQDNSNSDSSCLPFESPEEENRKSTGNDEKIIQVVNCEPELVEKVDGTKYIQENLVTTEKSSDEFNNITSKSAEVDQNYEAEIFCGIEELKPVDNFLNDNVENNSGNNAENEVTLEVINSADKNQQVLSEPDSPNIFLPNPSIPKSDFLGKFQSVSDPVNVKSQMCENNEVERIVEVDKFSVPQSKPELEDGEIVDDDSDCSNEKSVAGNEKSKELYTGKSNSETIVTKRESYTLTESKTPFWMKIERRIKRRHSLKPTVWGKVECDDEKYKGLCSEKLQVKYKKNDGKAGSCPPSLTFLEKIEVPLLDIAVEDIPLPPGSPLPENCFDFAKYLQTQLKITNNLEGQMNQSQINYKDKELSNSSPKIKTEPKIQNKSSGNRQTPFISSTFLECQSPSQPNFKENNEGDSEKTISGSGNPPLLPQNFKIKFSFLKKNCLKPTFPEPKDNYSSHVKNKRAKVDEKYQNKIKERCGKKESLKIENKICCAEETGSKDENDIETLCTPAPINFSKVGDEIYFAENKTGEADETVIECSVDNTDQRIADVEKLQVNFEKITSSDKSLIDEEKVIDSMKIHPEALETCTTMTDKEVCIIDSETVSKTPEFTEKQTEDFLSCHLEEVESEVQAEEVQEKDVAESVNEELQTKNFEKNELSNSQENIKIFENEQLDSEENTKIEKEQADSLQSSSLQQSSVEIKTTNNEYNAINLESIINSPANEKQVESYLSEESRMEVMNKDFDIVSYELNDLKSEIIEAADEAEMTLMTQESINCNRDDFYECEDIPTSEDLPNDDDMKVEKVSDDDKFRNIMQNCLDNAKKFLSFGNLKLFSGSVDDLLELDCSNLEDQEPEKLSEQSTNHISKDVLLTSCEDTVGDDLGLSDIHPTEMSMDFVPSFSSDVCPEILPVDNWPYLEEEVPASPGKSKTDESDLILTLDNETKPESRDNSSSHLGEVARKIKRDKKPKRLLVPGIDTESFKHFRRRSIVAEYIAGKGNIERQSENTVQKCLQRRKTFDGSGNFMSYSKPSGKDVNDFKNEIIKLKNNIEKVENLWQNNQSLKCRLSLKKLINKESIKSSKSLKSEENLCPKSAVAFKKKFLDYKSPTWQPKVKLLRIPKNELKKIVKSNKNCSEIHHNSTKGRKREATTQEFDSVSEENLSKSHTKKYKSSSFKNSSEAKSNIENTKPHVKTSHVNSERHNKDFRMEADEKNYSFGHSVEKKCRVERKNSVNGTSKTLFPNIYSENTNEIFSPKPLSEDCEGGVEIKSSKIVCQEIAEETYTNIPTGTLKLEKCRKNVEISKSSNSFSSDFRSECDLSKAAPAIIKSEKCRERTSKRSISATSVNDHSDDNDEKYLSSPLGLEKLCKKEKGPHLPKETFNNNYLEHEPVKSTLKTSLSNQNDKEKTSKECFPSATSERMNEKKLRFRNLHSKRKSEKEQTQTAKNCDQTAQNEKSIDTVIYDPEIILSKMFKDCKSPEHQDLIFQNKSTKESFKLTEEKVNNERNYENSLVEKKRKSSFSTTSPKHSYVKVEKSVKEMEKSRSQSKDSVKYRENQKSHGHRKSDVKSHSRHEHRREKSESRSSHKHGESEKKHSVKHKHGSSHERKEKTPGRDTELSKKNIKEIDTPDDRESTPEGPWVCEVCGFNDANERISHIKTHPFHCQSCHLAFKTEAYFVSHLTKKHKDIRNQHHCLLCELSFDTEDEYHRHLETREHRHLESVEKNTINTLFTLLTGQPCPVLGLVEMKPEWLPNQAGTVHFYHQATPLSLALQYLKMHHELTSFSTLSSAQSD